MSLYMAGAAEQKQKKSCLCLQMPSRPLVCGHRCFLLNIFMVNIYLPLNRGHVKTPPVAGISGKVFIFETTITAHFRILPNHILHTVLSQSTFIPRLREGSDDKEQRMQGDRGGMMKNGEKTKHVAAVFPLPKQTSDSKTQEVFVCLSAFNRISAVRYLYLGLDVVTQSHCLHRYIAYIDVSLD